MLESKIQKKIIDYIEKEKKFIVIKQIKTNKNGIPDLLVLTGNGKHLWIEVKQEKGIESEIQKFRREQLINIGDYCIVCYGFDDFFEKFMFLRF